MPTPPDGPAFLSVLPDAFAEARLPVAYRVMHGLEGGDGEAVLRSAVSEPYRAARFVCQPFHRPITKPLRAG